MYRNWHISLWMCVFFLRIFIYERSRDWAENQTTVSSVFVINSYLDNDLLSKTENRDQKANAVCVFGFVTRSMHFSIFHFSCRFYLHTSQISYHDNSHFYFHFSLAIRAPPACIFAGRKIIFHRMDMHSSAFEVRMLEHSFTTSIERTDVGTRATARSHSPNSRWFLHMQ